MGNTVGSRSPTSSRFAQTFRDLFKKSDLAMACAYLHQFPDLRQLFIQYFEQGQWIDNLVDELTAIDPSQTTLLTYLLPTEEVFMVRIAQSEESARPADHEHPATIPCSYDACPSDGLRRSLTAVSQSTTCSVPHFNSVNYRQHIPFVLLALRYFFKESEIVQIWWESMRRRRFSLLIPEALPLTPGRGAGAGRSPRVLPLPAVSALLGLSLRLPFFNPLNFLVFRLPRTVSPELTQVVAPLSVFSRPDPQPSHSPHAAESEEDDYAHRRRTRLDSLGEPAPLTPQCKPVSPLISSFSALKDEDDMVYPFHHHSQSHSHRHKEDGNEARLELESIASDQLRVPVTVHPTQSATRLGSVDHPSPPASPPDDAAEESALHQRIRQVCALSIRTLVHASAVNENTLRRSSSLDNLDSSVSDNNHTFFTFLGRKNWWEEVIRFLDEDLSLPLVISAAPTPETPAYPVVFLNRAFETLCQVPRDRLLGRDWLAELEDEQYSERLPLDLLHSAQSTGQCSLRAGVTLAKGPVHAERFLDLVSTRPVLDPVTSRHLYTLSVHYELCEGAQSVQCEEDLEAAEVWLQLMAVLLTP